jgi:uncharacterized membrane protein
VSKRNLKEERELNKQKKLPTIVPPTVVRQENSLDTKIAELKPEKTVRSTEEILIAASIEQCFGTVVSQLEQPCYWDSILTDVKPVSTIRKQQGATSQVTLNLGGKEVNSLAIISRYRMNQSISWISISSPKVKEDWRFKIKPGNILVWVSLALELDSWIFERLIFKARHWKRIEEDVDKMLNQLKHTAENNQHRINL